MLLTGHGWGVLQFAVFFSEIIVLFVNVACVGLGCPWLPATADIIFLTVVECLGGKHYKSL